MIERLDYFGWVWELESTNEVTFSTRYDEEKIDVSLWDVCGKGEHMEKSRYLLSNLLFCWCIRNLTLESGHWLSTYVQEEYEANCSAIHDCIVRVCGSTWWYWPQ